MAKKKDYSEDSKNFYINEQNKKKQKELEDKYGMTSFDGNSEAPPEVMNNFLDYVQQFEEQWAKAERKKIRDILGNPSFRKIEEIEPAAIEDEIKIVLDKYTEKNYNVDIIEKEDVNPEDFYIFLTEELMEHETDFINVPDMNTNFIYEEFHPNPKLNIKDCTDYFLWGIKKKDKEQTQLWSAKENLLLNNTSYNKDEFADNLFNLFPDGIEETKLTFKEISVKDLKAQIELLVTHKTNKKSISEIYIMMFEFNKIDEDYMEVRSIAIIDKSFA